MSMDLAVQRQLRNKDKVKIKMNYFNNDGRRIPSNDMRVFGETPQNYYQLKQPAINYSEVLQKSIEFGGVDSKINPDDFELACGNLQKEILGNQDYSNLFNGVHIPFICRQQISADSLGKDLEEIDLPNFKKSFNSQFPDCHFKAVLQSNVQLSKSVLIDPRARYDDFLSACSKGSVVGWYFPQALQEFDVESQRQQMLELPHIGNICLSGGVDILAALIGNPDLLISEEFYTPILCLSAYVHTDPRLVLLMKAYGPHMEFWCMTQMLTKNIKQVSEQWAGGITFYTTL